jgi:hypothetical protein|nr:MAG TPA: tail assembly protein [Caudoviricetes sp.]
MELVFSADNRADILVMPFVPPDISIEEPQNNEVFSGLSRDINLIGNLGLKTLSMSSFFPERKYPFCNPLAPIGAQPYIAFFRRWRAEKVPLRVVWTDNDGSEILNMPCTIDSFDWQAVGKMGRVSYSLTAKEYNFVVD